MYSPEHVIVSVALKVEHACSAHRPPCKATGSCVADSKPLIAQPFDKFLYARPLARTVRKVEDSSEPVIRQVLNDPKCLLMSKPQTLARTVRIVEDSSEPVTRLALNIP